MSNTRRPTLQRQHTRASEKKRNDELDLGLTINVNGQEYTVRQGDLTAMDTSALRREVGLSFRGLLEQFTKDPDIDLVAAFVWLARRVDGELLLSFEQVASEMDYSLELDVVGEAGSEEYPKA